MFICNFKQRVEWGVCLGVKLGREISILTGSVVYFGQSLGAAPPNAGRNLRKTPENTRISLIIDKIQVFTSKKHQPAFGSRLSNAKKRYFFIFFFEFFLKSIKFRCFPAFSVNFDQGSGAAHPNAGGNIQQTNSPYLLRSQGYK